MNAYDVLKAARDKADADMYAMNQPAKDLMLERLRKAALTRDDFDPTRAVQWRENLRTAEDEEMAQRDRVYREAVRRLQQAEMQRRAEEAIRQRNAQVGDHLRRMMYARMDAPVMTETPPTKEWLEWDRKRDEAVRNALDFRKYGALAIPSNLRALWASLGEPNKYGGGWMSEPQLSKLVLGYLPTFPLSPLAFSANTVRGVMAGEAMINLPHAILSGDWKDYATNIALGGAFQGALNKVFRNVRPNTLDILAGGHRPLVDKGVITMEVATENKGAPGILKYLSAKPGELGALDKELVDASNIVMRDAINREGVADRLKEVVPMQGAWFSSKNNANIHNPGFYIKVKNPEELNDIAYRLGSRVYQDGVGYGDVYRAVRPGDYLFSPLKAIKQARRIRENQRGWEVMGGPHEVGLLASKLPGGADENIIVDTGKGTIFVRNMDDKLIDPDLLRNLGLTPRPAILDTNFKPTPRVE